MKIELQPDDLATIAQSIDLRPLAAAIAERLAVDGLPSADNRLAFNEQEAAAAIGVAPHVLRDARRRGEIVARKIGKSAIYTREALMAFIAGGNGKQ